MDDYVRLIEYVNVVFQTDMIALKKIQYGKSTMTVTSDLAEMSTRRLNNKSKSGLTPKHHTEYI